MNHTVCHSKPVMTKTIHCLHDHVTQLDGHIFKKGRTTSTTGSGRTWIVNDVVNEGFTLLSQKKDLYSLVSEGTEEASVDHQISGDDLGVE